MVLEITNDTGMVRAQTYSLNSKHWDQTLAHTILFFFFFFFERVYLSQTDGICWGARCQMFLGHKILKV